MVCAGIIYIAHDRLSIVTHSAMYNDSDNELLGNWYWLTWLFHMSDILYDESINRVSVLDKNMQPIWIESWMIGVMFQYSSNLYYINRICTRFDVCLCVVWLLSFYSYSWLIQWQRRNLETSSVPLLTLILTHWVRVTHMHWGFNHHCFR